MAALFCKGPQLNLPSIMLQSSNVKLSNIVKYLGITFDFTLKLKGHILENDKHYVNNTLIQSTKGDKWYLCSYPEQWLYTGVVQSYIVYGSLIAH